MYELLQMPHVWIFSIPLIIAPSYFLVAYWNPPFARWLRNTVDVWCVPVIFLLGAAVLFCGNVGFGKNGETVPEALYETLQIYVFNIEASKLKGEGRPFLQAAMISATLLYVVVAVKGIWLLFRDSFMNMQLQVAFRHVVVCGLGRIGRQLVEDLLRNNYRTIVVIEPDSDNEHLEWARDHGALVIIGDATKPEILRAAQVHRAREVFLVTGKDECNIESAIELRDIMHKTWIVSLWIWRFWSPLKCRVHIIDYDLELIVREKAGNLKKSANDAKPVDKVRQLDIEVFSALERTARRLLEDISALKFNGKFIRPEKDEVAHFVLLGFGEFAQTLALKLAEFAHFENGKRLRLTIVDREIQKKASSFIARHPTFGPRYDAIPAWNFDLQADSWDSRKYRPVRAAQLAGDNRGIEYVCNAQYVEYVDATDANFLAGLRQCGTEQVRPVVLVCFEADRQNLAIAERLSAKLRTHGVQLPIFVWIPQQRELSQMLIDHRKTAAAGECNLIPFGQCDGSVSYSEITTSWTKWLARHFPLVWVRDDSSCFNEAVAKLKAAVQAADPTQAVAALALDHWTDLDKTGNDYWESCEEWERASNRSAAIHAVLKAAAVGMRIEGVAVTTNPIRTLFKAASAGMKTVGMKMIGVKAQVVGASTSVVNSIVTDTELEERLQMMEHYRWVGERLIAGWRWGPENDKVKKTRWQIIPYEELGDEKNKDANIVNFLLALMRLDRLKVSRIGQIPPPPKTKAWELIVKSLLVCRVMHWRAKRDVSAGQQSTP